MHCSTTDQVPWSLTGQKFFLPCSNHGIICKNADNAPAKCHDYMVRAIYECMHKQTAIDW